MFEELKTQIAKEIGNIHIVKYEVSDPAYKALLDLGNKYHKEKNYDKAIACYELAMDEIGWDNIKNTFPLREELLRSYICGCYFDCENAEKIAKLSATEMNESGAFEPSTAMKVGTIFMSNKDKEIQELGLQTLRFAYQSSKNLIRNCGRSDYNCMGVSLTARELIRGLFALEKYEEIYPIFEEAMDLTGVDNVCDLDVIIGVYVNMLIAYNLDMEYNTKGCCNSIDFFRNAKKNVPEALFALVLLEGDGIIEAKENEYWNLDCAVNLINEYKGDVDYPPYVFKAFFGIDNMDEIIDKYILNKGQVGKSKLYGKMKKKYTEKNNTEISSTSTNSTYSNSSSGGCYVATAVYGSYDCPEVWTLRRYRDNQLARTWYGRLFIHTYYAISPTLVKWFGETQWFKNMWKPKLDKMVKELQEQGVENTPYNDIDW